MFFRLPRAPEGCNLLDYPEEWQNVVQGSGRLTAMKPMIEVGRAVPAPFAVLGGVEVGAWSFLGHRYVLLISPSRAAAPRHPEALALWRELSGGRSEAQQVLPSCGATSCLPPERAL